MQGFEIDEDAGKGVEVAHGSKVAHQRMIEQKLDFGMAVGPLRAGALAENRLIEGTLPIEEDPVMQAFACAKAMIDTAEQMIFGNEPIAIGVGLNAGQVFIGNVVDEGKRQFTVLRTPINLAARFEGETKVLGASLVMGKVFCDRLPSDIQEQLVVHQNSSIKGAESQTLHTWHAVIGIGEE